MRKISLVQHVKIKICLIKINLLIRKFRESFIIIDFIAATRCDLKGPGRNSFDGTTCHQASFNTG